MEIQISFKKLHDDVILPSYAHEGDAGMDVHSREHRTLEQGEPHLFKLGFCIEMPKGTVGLIQDRSSMGKKGIRNLGGVVDAHYRGEWAVMLVNTTANEVVINKGDRIAQILFMPVQTAKSTIKDELSKTTRGDGGFGSSGK